MKHIYLTIAALFAAATVNVQAQTTANGHEYVDLGLPSGTLWATCNVGATNPEDYGDYYAWGETETKDNYTWETYKWCNGSDETLTKYNTSSRSGTVDDKTVLDAEDDAAHVKWGGSWRMPTKADMDELRTNSTWTWTSQNGVVGYKVTSRINGNSIFLPAAANRNGTRFEGTGTYGFYWSSSLYVASPECSYGIFLNAGNIAWRNSVRYLGNSIRPVIDKTATAIKAIDNDASTRGGLEETVYNLSGQRVGNDYKGIVVVNGKKRVVR